MHNLINAFPLYNFLKYCNGTSLEKTVLDCGAGGKNPPLSLFHEFGYKTYGIEKFEDQLERADEFCKRHNTELNIVSGDMTDIPFENEFFSFLFSYNTSVHMKKRDFAVALREFARVLKPGGLCYVNFLNDECDSYGKGKEVNPGEFVQIEDGEEVRYSHYREDELAALLVDFDIVYEETRVLTRAINDGKYKSGYIDYILIKR